jgi:photosystem II stability/assembly factor-like uncharacterized protein
VVGEGALTDFALAPSNPERVYAVSATGLHRSDDGGRSWNLLRDLEPFRCGVPTIAANDADHLMLADSCGGRLLRTRDGGRGWTEVSLNSRGGPWSFFVDPHDVDDVWMTNNELRHSLDGGATWQRTPTRVPGGTVNLLRSGSVAYALSSSVWRRSADGTQWFRRGGLPGGFFTVVDPRRSETLYSLGYEGLWRSLDGGRSFTNVASDPPRWVNDLIFDRHHAGRLLLATTEDGWRSDDGGTHWTNITAGIPDSTTSPARRVLRIAQDAVARDTLYVVRGLELFVSTNAGTTWIPRELSEPVESVTADPILHGKLYRPSGFPPRLHESSDSGRTWRAVPLPRAMTDDLIYSLELRFDDRGALVVFARDAFDCATLAGPFVRKNSGWALLGTSLPRGCLQDLLAARAPSGSTRWLAAIAGAGTWQLDLASTPARRQPFLQSTR